MLELSFNSFFHCMQFCEWDFCYFFIFLSVAVMDRIPLTATKCRLIYLAALLLTVNLRVSAADSGLKGWCGFF